MKPPLKPLHELVQRAPQLVNAEGRCSTEDVQIKEMECGIRERTQALGSYSLSAALAQLQITCVMSASRWRFWGFGSFICKMGV